MEPMRAIPTVAVGPAAIHERQAGNNRQRADAFRQALRQGADNSARGSAEDGERGDEQPTVRRTLQKQRDTGRKDEGTARHVDVIA
jgi:hypothetical protein